MRYLKLFFEFFKIGLFTFGGAYGAIPLIRECVERNEWMDEQMFSNMLAISESTPGPIMVNSATYIGNTQAGVLGALSATLGVVLSSFIIILLVSAVLGNWIKSGPVRNVLKGVKPCLMGVILATGGFMAYELFFLGETVDVIAMVIMALLLFVLLGYKKLRKKDFSPILLIVLAAVLGIVFY